MNDSDILLWHMREIWLGIGGTPEEATASFSENVLAKWRALEAEAAMADEMASALKLGIYGPASSAQWRGDWLARWDRLRVKHEA